MTHVDTNKINIDTIEKTRGLRELRFWILNHLDAEHTLPGLAAQIGVSISWLQRSFRKTYGCSVFAYIRYERLLRARRQLEVTSMSIRQISRTAGYRSLPAFTAAFSAAFDITPARFRREVKKRG